VNAKINVQILPPAANTLQMADENDLDLTRAYAERNSEPAFAQLVERHINLVYSVALRYTGGSQDAQDVTQAVFILLARKAASLRHRLTLTGWLYETTRLTARQLLRTRARRQIREQEAYMQSTVNETEGVWRQLEPLLEEAMARLTEKERALLALRYFENKTGAETAALLGLRPAAAHKRSARALEKLRKFFALRGATFSAVVIAGALSAHSVQAAPAALASSVTTGAVAQGAAAGTAALSLAHPAAKALAWAKYKFALGLAGGALLASLAVTAAMAGKAAAARPDPFTLYRNVLAARAKIQSGEMEILVARHDYPWNIQTNYTLLKVTFDGRKRHFEELQRESALATALVGDPKLEDAQKACVAKLIELGGDYEALARLGFVTLQDAHYRSVYDGQTITRFDSRSRQTNLSDATNGSYTYLFDPRTLGLAYNLLVDGDIDNYQPWPASSLTLIGREMVADRPAWHVRVQAPDGAQDFWVDVRHPTHLVKQEAPAAGLSLVSIFDEQHPADPLPVEVTSVNYYGGNPRPWVTRMFRWNSRYDVPIDPKAWSLAGLGMPVGTAVADDRLMRRIGYWTGAGLSDDFPRNSLPPADNTASTLEYTPESLRTAKTDASLVDGRKILARRLTLTGGWLALMLALSYPLIKRSKSKQAEL
jgi:RNA polymerase sigma factor (sigma-70 family)